jgi:hypothetical protein
MAGEAIQLMRVWRLKDVLIECFSAKVFLDLGKEFKPLKDVMMEESKYWDLHYSVCQLLFPLYSLLRLADHRIGVLDKVKYYVCQISRLMDGALADVVEKWKASDAVKISMLTIHEFPEDDKKGKAKKKEEEEMGEFVFVFPLL